VEKQNHFASLLTINDPNISKELSIKNVVDIFIFQYFHLFIRPAISNIKLGFF